MKGQYSQTEWYYIRDKTQQGPISERDLRHVFESGLMPLTTPVWREGMEEWQSAAIVMALVPKVMEPPNSMKQDPVQELIPKATPVAGLTGRLITRKLAWVLGLVALLGLLYYGGGNVRWKNTLSMEFVKVPNTEVMFSIWDTRVSDYRAYADANSGVGQSWKNPSFEQTDDHPVVNVSWVDAQAFCAWLTKKERGEGKIKSNQRYRLPTDEEWSVAVGLKGERGGSPRDKDMKIEGVYPWGTQWPPPKGVGNYDKSLGVDDYDYTSPVGSFNPNKHGLYDMGGNVWQWCEDWYDGGQTSRVLRGASWARTIPSACCPRAAATAIPSFVTTASASGVCWWVGVLCRVAFGLPFMLSSFYSFPRPPSWGAATTLKARRVRRGRGAKIGTGRHL